VTRNGGRFGRLLQNLPGALRWSWEKKATVEKGLVKAVGVGVGVGVERENDMVRFSSNRSKAISPKAFVFWSVK